jgi:hypothetical protein
MRPIVACFGPQRQRSAVPTIWPSRSATSPSAWRKACSQSAGGCGQRSSSVSAWAAAGRPRSSHAGPPRRNPGRQLSQASRHSPVVFRPCCAQSPVVPVEIRVRFQFGSLRLRGRPDRDDMLERLGSTNTNAERSSTTLRRDAIRPCCLRGGATRSRGGRATRSPADLDAPGLHTRRLQAALMARRGCHCGRVRG